MSHIIAALIAASLAAPSAADEPAAAAEPAVTIVLGPGQSTATPFRQGSARTGGGNIHVTQPALDTLSVTMTGAAAAKAHPFTDSVARLDFDLSQNFEVVFHSPKVKRARLALWGRTVGALRSDCACCKKGSCAEIATPGRAAVQCGPDELVSLQLPPRAVSGKSSLSIHDREGPMVVAVGPGKFLLHQSFGVSASHGKGLFCKKSETAEFAPDPALSEEWLGSREPFHGAVKKDFGFQVIVKVIPDEDEAPAKKDKP